MNKDKKIEIQNKIIHNLQQENASLSSRIKELEKQVNDNEELIAEANNYQKVHKENVDALIKAKEEYLKAASDINSLKANYKKEMNKILKTTKKNT